MDNRDNLEEKRTPAAGVETASVRGDLNRIGERLEEIEIELEALSQILREEVTRFFDISRR